MPHHVKRQTASAAISAVIALLLSLSTGPGSAQEQTPNVDEVIDEQSEATDSAQQSQAVVNALDDDIITDIAATREARQALNRLLIYNNNLETLIADQQAEVDSLQRQIDEFGGVEQDVVPLMFDMIDTLDNIIELDMPFLQKERGDRIARLRANMDRSDLTVSEKYRQIMEAYQVEAAYGRNIEAYVGTLEIAGAERRVDLLRIGRILLAYQTLDQAETGFWDKTRAQWVALDSSYRAELADGLRIARKQMAPRLLEVPVPAAGALE